MVSNAGETAVSSRRGEEKSGLRKKKSAYVPESHTHNRLSPSFDLESHHDRKNRLR
jgi:hypothetical protein